MFFTTCNTHHYFFYISILHYTPTYGYRGGRRVKENLSVIIGGENRETDNSTEFSQANSWHKKFPVSYEMVNSSITITVNTLNDLVEEIIQSEGDEQEEKYSELKQYVHEIEELAYKQCKKAVV